MNIYQKLHNIQKHVEKFVQDSKGHNYKYTSGSLVLSKIKPLMNDHGLLLKQEVLSIENERMDYATRNGNKTEILTKASMRFTWIDVESGETDVNLFGANGMNEFDKGFGSALTYAERYFLLKYFHIPTDEDNPEHIHRTDAATTLPHPTQHPTKSNVPTKPWLNKGTEDFTKAKNFIDKATDKQAAIKSLLGTYSISKEVQALLK